MKLLFLLFILPTLILNQPTLTTVDFTSTVVSSLYAVQSNPLGISMDLPQLLPHIDNNLFQQYLLNSNAYGNWDANFQQHIHVPVGYKYNCSLVTELSPNETVDCKMQLSNTTFIQSLANYIWNTTIDYAFTFGWDPQASLFSSNNYTQNSFLGFFFNVYYKNYQVFNMELADKANLYSDMGIKANYTMDSLLQDCNYINNIVYGITLEGPGLTATADSSWYQKISEMYFYCGFFTIRAVVFSNTSQLTIENLLSDQYTSEYLAKRLNVDGYSYLSDVANYIVVISDVRLTEDAATIDGVTNSFAAAIWAIDFSLEWCFMSGYKIDFYNSFKDTYQTLLGSGPQFNPNHLYSALLFLNSALLYYPKIHKAILVPGTSSSIKVYGLRYGYIASYGLIILNKDTSPSANGFVRVAISKQAGISCSYLSAPSLTSTSGSTISGVHFVSNSSKPIGDYEVIDYEVDGTGYYNIQVNYSQVVYCKSKIVASYKYFPTGRGAGEMYIVLSVLALLLLLF